MGVVDRLDQKTESSLELLDDGLDKSGEAQVWVLAIDVLCELRDGLSVGLRLELVALALEQDLELLVVCDDTVMDDGELPVGVGPGGNELASRTCSSWSCGSGQERVPRIASTDTHGAVERQKMTYLWGWQLTREGGPWVAHRVWAMPACESKTLLRSKSCSWTSFFNEATLPTSLTA
jgi:hypothetical protein